MIHQKLEEEKVIKNDECRDIRNHGCYLEHVDDMHPIKRKHRTKSISDERVAVTSTGGEAAMKSLASSGKDMSEEACNG